VHRQLGRHAVARASDLEALVLGEGSAEATFDAVLGLASDAVGLGDVGEATDRLAEARRLIPARAGEWWRQRVRLGWGEAEVQLLEGDPEAAVQTALEAVDRAEGARAPRHVAKGLLILGLAQVSAKRADAVSLLAELGGLPVATGAIAPGLSTPLQIAPSYVAPYG